MQTDVDLVILGGGCAGLSLGTRLAEFGATSPTAMILEARIHYTNDRTWCFWEDGDSRLQSSIKHRWQKLGLRAQGRELSVDCGTNPYCLLPAEEFYRAAVAAISRSERVNLTMNEKILTPPRKTGDRWMVDTANGSFNAKMVVDTRPTQQPKRGGAILWQSFYGREIECDVDTFDSSRADLMDFSPGGDANIRFTYCLPMSSTRALIETTVFGVEPQNRLALSRELDTAIERYVAHSGYIVLRSEEGILPMGITPVKADPDKTYVRVGLTSGGARPSTGYAFQRIQRWADKCAQSLQAGRLPLGHAPDPFLLRAMDHLFLSVLRAHPAEAPLMFLSLFEKVHPSRLIRFLGDGGSLLDYAIVASSLPIRFFLAEIPTAFFRATERRAAR